MMDLSAPRMPRTVALGDRCLVVSFPKGRLEEWLPEDDARAFLTVDFYARTLSAHNPEQAKDAVWSVWRVVEA